MFDSTDEATYPPGEYIVRIKGTLEATVVAPPSDHIELRIVISDG